MNQVLSSVLKKRIIRLSSVCHKCMVQQEYIFCSSGASYNTQPKLNSFKFSMFHERQMSLISGMIGIKKKLSGFFPEKTKVRASGCLILEKIADDIDYDEFFKCFELPDTFFSWFLSLQLHVWMVLSVTITERQGRVFRNSLVDAMWHDVETRLGKLGTQKSSKKRAQLKEFYSQFQAAIVSYDEGNLSEDIVLAAAVWRTMFLCKPVDPQLLEKAVLYVRKQLSYLESQNTQNIVFEGSISFLSLKNIFSDYKEI